MLKTTLISLCSLYQLTSANPRILLQAIPELPPAVTSTTLHPEASTTKTVPAVSISPIAPVVPVITTTSAAAASSTAAASTSAAASTTAAASSTSAASTTASSTAAASTTAKASTTPFFAADTTTTTTTNAPAASTAASSTAAASTAASSTAAASTAAGSTTGAPTSSPVAASTTTTTAVPVAPVTTTTTTSAPATTGPPPDGFQYGAYGQLCALTTPATTNAAGVLGRSNQCVLPTDVANDAGTGRLDCARPSDCCMCSAIDCGSADVPCSRLVLGASSGFGVKDINIIGDAAYRTQGAVVTCDGIDACRESVMDAERVFEVECGADDACRDAVIRIQDPKNGFAIDCGASGSCAGLTLEISFTGPPEGFMCNPDPVVAERVVRLSGIECNGNAACEGLSVTIDNSVGCHPVLLENVDCLQANACDGATFNLIGDIDIMNCQCGPSCSNAMGLEACFTGVEYLVCSDPEACSGLVRELFNPAPYFEVICGNVASCENAQFTLTLVADAAANIGTIWKGFKLGGSNAARGATFVVDNQLPTEILTIELLECGGLQSCSGTTFVTTGNVVIEKIVCSQGSCLGCTLNGEPCDPEQITVPEVIQTLPATPTEPATPIVALPTEPNPTAPFVALPTDPAPPAAVTTQTAPIAPAIVLPTVPTNPAAPAVVV